MSQQSDMAERVYDRLTQPDVSAAELVEELRANWGPEHGAREVHGFVDEVAACILYHHDVEVGDIRPNEALQPTAARSLFVIPSGVEESLDISDHPALGNHREMSRLRST